MNLNNPIGPEGEVVQEVIPPTPEEIKQQTYFEENSGKLAIEIMNNLPHEQRIPFLKHIEVLIGDNYYSRIHELEQEHTKLVAELNKFKEGK